MAVSVGQNAIPFSLFDTEKNKINLDDYRGKKVLVLFFPLAFTSVCTKELCSIRDGISFYNDANAQVLGISVDSLFTLNKFKEEQNLNFPLLSDFNKETSEAYGAIYPQFGFDMKGVSKRAAFVIDSKGVIQYAEVLDNAGELPNFEAINTTLNSIN
jgi:glutaredoxin-dependent peroxiredoxin